MVNNIQNFSSREYNKIQNILSNQYSPIKIKTKMEEGHLNKRTHKILYAIKIADINNF